MTKRDRQREYVPASRVLPDGKGERRFLSPFPLKERCRTHSIFTGILRTGLVVAGLCVGGHWAAEGSDSATATTSRKTVTGGKNVVLVPGTVTVKACRCSHHGDSDGDAKMDALDLSFLVDYVFFGGMPPLKEESCPHVDRGDMTCDGVDDVLDVMFLRDHIFSGGPAPCDPCECDPYPTGCP